MPKILSRPEMEIAFYHGDAGYDGLFVVGVRTTGIFCKPSCPARKPLPQNMEYCRTVRDALFAGWCRALRLGQAFTRLREGAEIDKVVFEHGFESHSGFREAFGRLFGLPPGKALGKDVIVATLVQTPLGPMVAAAVDRGLCLLEFSDRRMLQAQLLTVSRRMKLSLVPGDHPHLRHLRKELEAYFEGRLRSFTVPLFTPGTPFQEAVWQELKRIPHGETTSYEALAERIGKPAAVRAVGHANGMNPVSILIPCHRVVNKDGNLCGYGGGLWRKRLLLELERTGQLSTVS